MKKQTYFFCGIGGVGMNALAQILLAEGHKVAGSDRAYDMGIEAEKFQTLKRLGVQLYPQDGSGVGQSQPDFFVVSTAVEDTIPDVQAAKEAGLNILHRSELLVALSHTGTLITVGGTSGKSTTTGMLGHILSHQGLEPRIIGGAGIVGQENPGLSYAAGGNDSGKNQPLSLIEVDESDGSIAKSVPDIAVLNNISQDHKSMAELRQLFGDYLNAARKGVVLNLDCAESMNLDVQDKKTVTFSLENQQADFYATNIKPEADGVCFNLNGETPVKLTVFGWYNVANALAAIAATTLAGVPAHAAAQSLETFKGMKRRLERLGTQNGVMVIDDFAHNPHKIAATLKALKEYPGRLFIVYQPHGFAPTKMFRNALVDVFQTHLSPEDKLYMPDIYFVGGTADKTISSGDLTAEIAASGLQAYHVPNRADIPAAILPALRPGDRVCVMGARDNTLSDFAHNLLHQLERKSA